MLKRLSLVPIAAAAALFVMTGAEAAMNAHANAGVNIGAGAGPFANSARASVSTRTAVLPRGFSEGQKVGFRGRHVPPGWSRKVGWHQGLMPPGLRR